MTLRRDDRVAITGAGIVCSLGSSRREVWNALLSGQTGIRPVEGFDATGFGCRSAAQIQGIGPQSLNIHPRDARIMALPSYMLLKCSRDAFSEAGVKQAPYAKEDIGFFAGMGMVDYRTEDLLPGVVKSLGTPGDIDYDRFYTDGYRQIHPLWPLSMLNNIGFCQVAIDLDIRGENAVFSPHADSGAQAVAEGMHTVLEGRSPLVLAGGVSEKISPFSLARGMLAGIFTLSGDRDAMPCRPFADDRNGTVPGEGCGVLSLEFYHSAVARGIPVLAVLAGYGAAFESDTPSPGPTAAAFENAMRGSLRNGGFAPSDIDMIIAHGEGTLSGDRNEADAIHEVFSDRINDVSVFSSKGALGHLLAGAPVVDIIMGIEMLEAGMVPPTLTSSPESSLRFHLVKQPLKRNMKRILVNSQSCEGQAASIIIEAVQ